MNPHVCPLCHEAQTKILLDSASDYLTGEAFQVWQCANCELGFTYPQPKSMESYYPSQYRNYRAPILVLLKALYRARAGSWSRMTRSPGSVLELGCGSGIMLDALRREGWRVLGIERTAQAASFARQCLGLPVFVGGPEAVRPHSRFDLIIAFQTLEHLPDPAATLEDCTALLKPGGIIVVAAPNLDSWQARFAGPHWFHLDVPRHLHHFSRKSLQQAFNLAGLSVSRISFVSLEHDPYGWIESILNRAGLLWGNHQNSLTRHLMRLDPLTPGSFLVMLIAALMFVPSLVLSTLSWVCRKGAIIQVIGIRPMEGTRG